MKRFALMGLIVVLMPMIALAQDPTLIDLMTLPQRLDTFAPQSTARLYRFYAEQGASITLNGGNNRRRRAFLAGYFLSAY